ncbi:uncharacterized protein TRIADDRAFT_51790 [Trichoplax adhaerens]|uniref:Cilia- and flagella-associated protein 70 n=1 Tax=Trichoplax adhaerens TaxID=10228 RepID=B3RKW6_TRIAD|nr:hypothetical protein TRIADDRAFT_51790 [Trichoplax adhaerens]EDV28658.1 hypothetical protein TRIADDRAFT_51790 [Trichoplax adhaerens]|eukprot:XP_002107860.1 hypothetical protein TRIADDRAFT_51790 [Trichoplax adhaerens]
MANQEDTEKRQRTSETITISVVRGRNLKSTKNETLTSTVKIEFGHNVIGESSKIEGKSDYTVDYNYNASWSCSLIDPLALDDLVYKPVIVSVTEVLSRERKQKEERSILLGQTCIDLLPLLKGEERFTVRQPLFPPNPHADGHTDTFSNLPQIEVEISTAEPLLSESEIAGSNMFSFRVESAYAVPEVWHQSNLAYHYVTATPIPVSQDKEVYVTIANGNLKSAMEREGPGAQRKWASTINITNHASYIINSNLPVVPFKDEDGDLTKREDHQFRVECETDRSRVTWNAERRCWMDSDAVSIFKTRIAHHRVWPIEIMKVLPQTQTKTRKGAHEEELSIHFHGVAYVDFAPLLYPGAQRLRGAYLVQPFSESEIQDKVEHRSIADEAAQIVSGLNRSVTSAIGKKTKKTTQSVTNKQSDGTVADGDGTGTEAQAYLENKTFIMIEICLDKPLVPKRPPSSLAKRVSEYIPPRSIFPTRIRSAQKTLDSYHKQVDHVAKLILNEYRLLNKGILGNHHMPQDTEIVDERRKELLYELNTSGKYFAFKEQMKHAIVKVVREKFLITKPFEDKDQLNNFLSELYSYLIDEMHVGLSKALSMKDDAPPPVTVIDANMMKHFAKEAEENGNYELAARYYQERLACNKNDPCHWFDYGTFCLLIGDINKAEECFKEALTINQQFVPGLILYGIVCHMDERNDEAETFLEAATTVEHDNILAWTILGLFYNSIEKEIFAEMALKEACRLNLLQAEKIDCNNLETTSDDHQLNSDAKLNKDKDKEIALEATESQSIEAEISRTVAESDKHESPVGDHQIPSTHSLEAAPSHSLKVSNTTSKKGTTQKRGSRQGKSGLSNIAANKNRAQSALSGGWSNPDTEIGSFPAGVVQPTEIPPPPPRPITPIPDQSTYMRAAQFLLRVNAFQMCEKALGAELIQYPKSDLPTQYYLHLAQLKLQMKQYDVAERNIEEALIHDYTNSNCWAILGHIKYLTSNYKEARSAYERTLALIDTADNMHIIYLRLASIYLGEKLYENAKNTFLLACKHSPSCLSWLGVGIACYRMGDLSEAEEALSEANVLNNHDAEVWGYLSLVCLRTNREEEAEQAYKYALKVGLSNKELLQEINEQQKVIGFGNPLVSTILSQ